MKQLVPEMKATFSFIFRRYCVVQLLLLVRFFLYSFWLDFTLSSNAML